MAGPHRLRYYYYSFILLLMARTKHTGSPSVAVHSLPVANTMESAIRTQETRLRHKKVHLPMPLNGTESAADPALVYYTLTAKIDTEGHMVPFHACLLAKISQQFD